MLTWVEINSTQVNSTMYLLIKYLGTLNYHRRCSFFFIHELDGQTFYFIFNDELATYFAVSVVSSWFA